MNEALMDNTERMLDLEFVVKQKAQLKYLQAKQQKFKTRLMFINMLSHDFLWSPTPAYYIVTLFIWQIAKSKIRLTPIHLIPMTAIPISMDYFKRDHYCKM